MFGDLFQAGIGTHERDDIAVTVLASVIGRRPDAHRFLIDAGGLALSKDRSTEALPDDCGFGLVRDAAGRRHFGRAIVERAYQEHGVVACDPALPWPDPRVGERVRVAPNHTCMTAAAHDRYFVVDGGERGGRGVAPRERMGAERGTGMTERAFALATLEIDGAPVPCIEIEGVAYRLAPAMARIGAADWPSLRALFDDWVQAAPLLGRAAAAVRPEDRATPDAVRLAPLLYPGKIFCAGANYYDHLAEMGMPGARKEDQRLFFFAKPPRNAVVGPGRTVRMPLDTHEV